jgi:hypothetical protein
MSHIIKELGCYFYLTHFFFKKLKMKILFFCIIIITIGCNNKKKQIVDQIFHYRDSLGLAQVQLSLVDTIFTPEMSLEQSIKLQPLALRRKLKIKHKIYQYEWMLDSLEMELKKY